MKARGASITPDIFIDNLFVVQLITFSTDMMPIWDIWINYYIIKIGPEFLYFSKLRLKVQ